MTWQKGQSGNPSGRRAGLGAASRDLEMAVRKEFPVDKILELVRDFLASDDEEIRLKAFQWLAERGYGKALQPVDVDVTVTAKDLTDRELIGELAEAFKELAPEERAQLMAPIDVEVVEVTAVEEDNK